MRARFAAIAFSNLRNNHHRHRRHFGLFSLDTLVSAHLFARPYEKCFLSASFQFQRHYLSLDLINWS